MTAADGPRRFGPLDNEIRRLRSLSEQLHTAAQDVGRFWSDSWHGTTSNAFGKVRDRLGERPRRVGSLVDKAIDALTNYRKVLGERQGLSADTDLIAWRQRLATAGAQAADRLRLVNQELAELSPIFGESGGGPAPIPIKPALRPATRSAPRVAAELPSPNDSNFSNHTAAVCDELLDAEFGELKEAH